MKKRYHRDNPAAGDALLPKIVIAGRPNVGKSSLFNRLLGQRRALVMDEPGLTRDVLSKECQFSRGSCLLQDTAGLFGGADRLSYAPLAKKVHDKTLDSLKQASLVLWVVDIQSGMTPQDKDLARVLRQLACEVWIVANKADVARHDMQQAFFYHLGFKKIFAISAEHGRGLQQLTSEMQQHLWPKEAIQEKDPWAIEADAQEDADQERPEETPKEAQPLRLLIAGRPNVGKSSLLNCLLGEERMMVADMPGTTMDAVDSYLRSDGQDFVLIDSAGIRRKRSIFDAAEQLAVNAAFTAIDRADVVVLVLDGLEIPSDQDVRLAAMIHDKGKGLMFAVNKWDEVVDPTWKNRFSEAIRLQFSFAHYAPILKISAKTGFHVNRILPTALDVRQSCLSRIGTGELNRFFKEVVDSKPPPVKNGKRPQLYYVSQPLCSPPTFIFASSRSKDLHFSYKRYLENSIRKRYPLLGTPIWLKFRDHHSSKQ